MPVTIGSSTGYSDPNLWRDYMRLLARKGEVEARLKQQQSQATANAFLQPFNAAVQTGLQTGMKSLLLSQQGKQQMDQVNAQQAGYAARETQRQQGQMARVDATSANAMARGIGYPDAESMNAAAVGQGLKPHDLWLQAQEKEKADAEAAQHKQAQLKSFYQNFEPQYTQSQYDRIAELQDYSSKVQTAVDRGELPAGDGQNEIDLIEQEMLNMRPQWVPKAKPPPTVKVTTASGKQIELAPGQVEYDAESGNYMWNEEGVPKFHRGITSSSKKGGTTGRASEDIGLDETKEQVEMIVKQMESSHSMSQEGLHKTEKTPFVPPSDDELVRMARERIYQMRKVGDQVEAMELYDSLDGQSQQLINKWFAEAGFYNTTLRDYLMETLNGLTSQPGTPPQVLQAMKSAIQISILDPEGNSIFNDQSRQKQ